ncbi:DUF4159 domain-containing protein [Lentisphaerota bacterium WC36G]|nr:DUF4159 domain-containing protein [Lentisphaerae bacterium WC36]
MKKFKIILFLTIVMVQFSVFAESTNNDYRFNAYESKRGSRTSWARGKMKGKSESWDKSKWYWHQFPFADLRFIQYLSAKTSVNMLQDWNVVSLRKLDHMVAFPVIFLQNEHAPDVARIELRNLKEYMLRGGIIWVDDCVYRGGNLYYTGMIKILKILFPEVVLNSYYTDHEILSYYYKYKRWVHWQGINTGLTLAYNKGRLIAVLSGSDIHCAWAGVEYPATRRYKNASFRLGTNIYLYMMNN